MNNMSDLKKSCIVWHQGDLGENHFGQTNTSRCLRQGCSSHAVALSLGCLDPSASVCYRKWCCAVGLSWNTVSSIGAQISEYEVKVGVKCHRGALFMSNLAGDLKSCVSFLNSYLWALTKWANTWSFSNPHPNRESPLGGWWRGRWQLVPLIKSSNWGLAEKLWNKHSG